MVDVFDYGATGVGISTTITHFITMIATYIYTSRTLTPELKL